ncbi:MFS transporter [Dendrosporobacter sp. 1207_IL3150]|uniref:MFS transporter n=1 Tax=Dendrosporobacter sp. 1207_IL3150 TaxID=3084054 RepID=UPI002FDB6BAF
MRKLTYLAYLVFISLGLTTTLFGIVLLDISRTFAVEPFVIGYILALLPIGSTSMMPLSGKLLETMPLKALILAALLIMSTSLITMISSSKLLLFAASMLMLGLSNGMLISIANYLIVHLYDNNARPSYLNMLNFFYSFGAVAAPFISGILIKYFTWQLFFCVSLFLLLITGTITLNSDFKHIRRDCPLRNAANTDKWGKPIYYIGSALFCYVLSEFILVNWTAVYFRQNLSLSSKEASTILFFFFVLMAIGRFFSGYIIKFIKIDRYILICSVSAIISFIILLIVPGLTYKVIASSLMGFGYSGIYASLLSYGTQQLPYPSPKLVTYYITSGSAGAIAGLIVSGLFEQFIGTLACLILSIIAMLLVFGLVILARKPEEKEDK